MPQYGSWRPYAGSDALVLAAVLLVIAGLLAFLGARLRSPTGVTRPGKTVRALLIVIWVLSLATLFIAVITYGLALYRQVGTYTPPKNPIAPVTALSGLAAFLLIAFFSRGHGWKVALGSAIVGTIAAPLIFELPFDLIVMRRVYSPTPAGLFIPLFFLPLFLVEVASFALLTFSPLMRVSKYTLFALAGMFLIFAVWALFGFAYPSAPIPTALNMISKILSFAAAVALFLPYAAPEANRISGQ